MNNKFSILRELGFSEKELSVYLTILELGQALPSSISRKTGIKRPTVYMLLENLSKKGFVTYVIKNGTRYYDVISPNSLLELEKNRYEELEKLLPDLMNLKQRFEVTPQMAVFEGTDGIIQIMEDTLTADSDIFCWSAGNIAYEDDKFKEYHSKYVERKIKKGIWIRGLFQYDEVGLELKRRGAVDLREAYLIPVDKFPFENEINIYNDKVSIISHKDQVGVIIQNQAIANTQRAIFNFAFEYAQMLEPQVLKPKHKKEFYPKTN